MEKMETFILYHGIGGLIVVKQMTDNYLAEALENKIWH